MRNLYLVRHGKPQYPDEHSYCVGQTERIFERSADRFLSIHAWTSAGSPS